MLAVDDLGVPLLVQEAVVGVDSLRLRLFTGRRFTVPLPDLEKFYAFHRLNYSALRGRLESDPHSACESLELLGLVLMRHPPHSQLMSPQVGVVT